MTNLIDIIFIGIGLAMDAVCVSMSNGMCFKPRLKHILSIGIAFGLFQGLMPLIGFFAGSVFTEQIKSYDHWIALVLLAFLGGKMLFDAFKKDNDKEECTFLTLKLLFIQAIATSIDALAVGVSFAAMNINIYLAITIIAVITFVLSIIAVYIGKRVGTRLNKKAEIVGGLILIFIGVKIFIEHMFF